VAEALAARCPVVGSRIGGIPDFIEDGASGFLVPPDDPVALTQAIHRFLADPQLLYRLRGQIQKPRGFEGYLDDLEGHYREVAGSRSAAATGDAGRPAKPGSTRHELEIVVAGSPDSASFDEAIAAYLGAFKAGESVGLTTVPIGGPLSESQVAALSERLARLLAAQGLSPDSCPDLTVCREAPAGGLARLLSGADAFVDTTDPPSALLEEAAAAAGCKRIRPASPAEFVGLWTARSGARPRAA